MEGEKCGDAVISIHFPPDKLICRSFCYVSTCIGYFSILVPANSG